MVSTLEIDSVYRIVNQNLTLSDIYLKCKTSDIIGIVGRNGSGKSLLMKIIFGIEKTEYKFIRINNKIIKEPYKKFGLITYLPQNSFLPQNLNVIDVINLYIDKSEISSFRNDEIINQILKSKISQLSGGELRYLEIKLLLNFKSYFVLLDEPFSNISPILKEKIIKLILEKSNEKGIILTDHDYYNLKSIVTKLYLMNKGSLKRISDESELKMLNYLPKNY
jgi:lipopolysaccharide export system ATP-binding protein